MKFSVKAFFAGVILSMLFIFAKNIYSCELSAQSGRGVYSVMKKGSLDNLYIGSSMFRQGITLYNDDSDSFLICYNGLDPVTGSLILEYALRNGLAVRNIYFDMCAHLTTGASSISDRRLIFDSPFELKFSVWDKVIRNEEAGFFSDTWEFFAGSGNDMFILWPMYNRLTAKRFYKGGDSADTIKRGLTPYEMEQRKQPEFDTGKMHGSQKEAVTRIITLCRKYNVNLIFTETPKYKDYESNEGYITLMNEYVNLLSGSGVKLIISRGTLQNVRAGDGKNIYAYDFPSDDTLMFQDHIHLSTEGSRKFMAALREIQNGNGMRD